jgi:N-acetylglucosaminyl-diphospho-decaprenol L-rhamnosyltransferase
VGPATLTAEGELYPSARAVPSLRNGVGHALFANLWISNPWSRAYRNDADAKPVRRDAGWLSGACVLVRRSAFEELGGFDPEFFMYFEDVDLGYRLGKLGYRNVYEPAAVVTHTGAHSTASDSLAMIKAHHDSARRFLDKKYSGWKLWPVRTALAVGLKLRSSLIGRRIHHG